MNSTFYKALAIEPDYLCEEFVAGDHLECEVEDSEECKHLGDIKLSIRQAEVFGRVEKMTGRISFNCDLQVIWIFLCASYSNVDGRTYMCR